MQEPTIAGVPVTYCIAAFMGSGILLGTVVRLYLWVRHGKYVQYSREAHEAFHRGDKAAAHRASALAVQYWIWIGEEQAGEVANAGELQEILSILHAVETDDAHRQLIETAQAACRDYKAHLADHHSYYYLPYEHQRTFKAMRASRKALKRLLEQPAS